MTDDEMVGWHHWLNGHEFEQTLGDSEGQGSLVRLQKVRHDLATEQKKNQWQIPCCVVSSEEGIYATQYVPDNVVSDGWTSCFYLTILSLSFTEKETET